MKKCPQCGDWMLDFDGYFGRYRCFACGWMTRSSTERDIRCMREYEQPRVIDETHINELNLTIKTEYDPINDALIFDFGLKEPSFDLPEVDGRMVWQISHVTSAITGFVILDAKQLVEEVSQIEVYFKVASCKEDVERRLKNIPISLTFGRATKVLIEKVSVTAHKQKPSTGKPLPEYVQAIKAGYEKFKNYINSPTQGNQPVTA